jgi:hypothetical protein
MRRADQRFRWWQGEDLNLRPWGYELDGQLGLASDRATDPRRGRNVTPALRKASATVSVATPKRLESLAKD